MKQLQMPHVIALSSHIVNKLHVLVLSHLQILSKPTEHAFYNNYQPCDIAITLDKQNN